MVSAFEQHPPERFAHSADPGAGPNVYLTKPLEVSGFVQTVKSPLKQPQA